MPKKTLKKSVVKKDGYLAQINWGESYTSLFLGAVVVVVALILLFSFLKARNMQNQQTQSTSTTSGEVVRETRPKTYTVKEGESLWQISEKIYKSGYNWVDLASANHLVNPGILFVNTKLIVPDVMSKQITVVNAAVEQSLIKGDTYTVKKGDYLWNIAIRAYGDGYKWVEIAKANNLANPSLIYSGNVLRLPRQ